MFDTLLDEDLIEIYLKAIQLDLEIEFIFLLTKEMHMRGIEPTKLTAKKWLPIQE